MNFCAINTDESKQDKTEKILYMAVDSLINSSFAGRSGGYFVSSFNDDYEDILENCKYELQEGECILKELREEYNLKEVFNDLVSLELLSQWVKEMSEGLDFHAELEFRIGEILADDDEYISLCKDTFQLEFDM